MDIELFNGQVAQVFITLNTELDDFDVYGGTTKAQFDVERTENGEYLVTVPNQASQMCSLPRYDIFAKRISTGQEWCILSGKINTKSRCSTGGGLSPVQYRVTVPVVEDSVDATGKTMVIGIKGDKGDSLIFDDLTEEQKAELTQPALDAVSEHSKDTTAHVTANERTAWNNSSSNWTLDRPRLGVNATASSEYTTALGAGAKATSGATTAVGYGSSATFGTATSVGMWAKSTGTASVAVGKEATCAEGGVTVGTNANTTGWRGLTFGFHATNSGRLSTAIGYKSNCADGGVAVLSVWDFNCVTQTNFYIIGANTSLSNKYENGEACLGYLVKDTSGNVLAAGTRKLSELLTNNTTFKPADLGDETHQVFLPTGATDPIEELELPEMEETT